MPPSAAGTVSVNLTWNASASSNVGGYIFSYGTGSGVYTQSIDVGNNTSTTLTGLQSGTAYYFAVSAYDTTRGLISNYSSEAAFNAPPPPTVYFAANQTSGNYPLDVSLTPSTTGAITSWQWNFGDGSISSGNGSSIPATTKWYGTAGSFTVSLKANRCSPHGACVIREGQTLHSPGFRKPHPGYAVLFKP